MCNEICLCHALEERDEGFLVRLGQHEVGTVLFLPADDIELRHAAGFAGLHADGLLAGELLKAIDVLLVEDEEVDNAHAFFLEAEE